MDENAQEMTSLMDEQEFCFDTPRTEIVGLGERNNATKNIDEILANVKIPSDEEIRRLEEIADFCRRRSRCIEKIHKYTTQYPDFDVDNIVVPTEEEVSSLEKKADLVKRKQKALALLKRLPESAYASPSEKQVKKLEKKVAKTRCSKCAYIDVEVRCLGCNAFFCADCLREMGTYCECGMYFS